MGHRYHDNSYDPMLHSFMFSSLDDIYQFTGHTTGISTALSFQIGRILELPNILLTFITSYPPLCVNKSTPYRLSVDLYQISCISLVKKTKLSPPERFLMAAKNKQVLSPYIFLHRIYNLPVSWQYSSLYWERRPDWHSVYRIASECWVSGIRPALSSGIS